MAVKRWGTGRKDYSNAVEKSVVPIIRSYQRAATQYGEFSLSAGEEKEITVDMDFSPSAQNHFIYQIDFSVDANVLISAELWSEDSMFTTEQGYQSISLPIPQGLGLSQVTFKIKNNGNMSVNGAYSYNGIQGTEKIMPISGW